MNQTAISPTREDFLAPVPRRLSENREPTAEKRTLVHFPAHFR